VSGTTTRPAVPSSGAAGLVASASLPELRTADGGRTSGRAPAPQGRAARAVGHDTTVPNRAGPAAPRISPWSRRSPRGATVPALRARIPHATACAATTSPPAVPPSPASPETPRTTVSPANGATAPRPHVPMAPQRHSATAPQRHSATAPQRHSATASQRHSVTAPQRHSATAPQHHSTTAPQRHCTAFRSNACDRATAAPPSRAEPPGSPSNASAIDTTAGTYTSRSPERDAPRSQMAAGRVVSR
jgi:hypothetical protein